MILFKKSNFDHQILDFLAPIKIVVIITILHGGRSSACRLCVSQKIRVLDRMSYDGNRIDQQQFVFKR
jgi:hypothetical protein